MLYVMQPATSSEPERLAYATKLQCVLLLPT